MTGTEGHLSRDVSIVIQTENTEIFYTLHFLLAHNYTTAASLQISHVFLYQGGHLEMLDNPGGRRQFLVLFSDFIRRKDDCRGWEVASFTRQFQLMRVGQLEATNQDNRPGQARVNQTQTLPALPARLNVKDQTLWSSSILWSLSWRDRERQTDIQRK